MSRTAIRAPTIQPPTAIQVRTLAPGSRSTPDVSMPAIAVTSQGLLACVPRRVAINGRSNLDCGRYRHPRKQATGKWIRLVDGDLDRNTLDDLGKVAGRVVGRQQGELLTACRR